MCWQSIKIISGLSLDMCYWWLQQPILQSCVVLRISYSGLSRNSNSLVLYLPTYFRTFSLLVTSVLGFSRENKQVESNKCVYVCTFPHAIVKLEEWESWNAGWKTGDSEKSWCSSSHCWRRAVCSQNLFFLLRPQSFSMKAFNWLDGAHSYHRGQSALHKACWFKF